MKKEEKLFRAEFKKQYFAYQECYNEWGALDDDTKRESRNLQVYEDIAKNVFGFSDKQVEINEDRWRKEWRNKNEWRYS